MELYCFKKKYIIFLLLFSVNLFAADRDLFSFSVSKKIKYIEGKENKKIVKQFLKNWKSNSFNKNDKDIIIHYVSSFENRSFNQEYYINFFSFCNYLVVNNSKKLSNWLNSSFSSINNLSDFDLDIYLQTNYKLVKQNILFEINDFSWSFSGDVSLSFRDNKPYYSLNLDTLFLSNNYNEIIIYQTQGEFDLINKTLNAKGGYMGWERIGVPISDRKVLLDSFELDLTNRKINLDNVILENNLHFKIITQGKFIDYLSRAKKQNSYPKFYANKEAKAEPIFNGFSCLGLINILKDKIYFKSYDDSFVKLIYEDEDFKGEFIGKSFSLKDSTLSSGKVSSKFYFNESNDSIFHPEMRFLYSYNDNQISLNRLNNTYLSDRPILNSFHGLNIYADFFKINLDQEKIFFSSTCLNDKNYILFESVDYYEDSRYKDLNLSDLNMLDVLFNYIKRYDKRNNILVNDFALYMDMTFDKALHIISTLEIFDLVNYNSFSEMFNIKERAFDFYNSKNKKYDYDQLSIESLCFLGDTVSIIDMNDLTMNISNVKKINLQFDSSYDINLNDEEIIFFKNRDFVMNANLKIGNFNIKSDSVVFSYDDFNLFYPNYSDFEIINAGMIKNRECIEKIIFKNGYLEIDSLTNKSGVIENYDFPKFHFSDSTYIYGNDNAIILNLHPMTINYFDEIAIDNLVFNGSLSVKNAFESLAGDMTLNKSTGINFISYDFILPFFNNDSIQGDFNFSDSELRFSGKLKNTNFTYFSDNMLINSSKISSKKGDLIFNSSSSYPSINADNISMDYVLFDSIKFNSKNKRLFSLYDDYSFFGEIILDLKIEDVYLTASGNFISSKDPDFLFDISSDLFLFSKNSFISANSIINFNSSNNEKFNLNGISLEFNLKSDSIYFFRENLNFQISSLNADIDFQASLLDLKSRELKFFNLDSSQGICSFNDKINYNINSMFFDFNTQRVSFITNNFLDFGSHKLIPKDGFFEINNEGVPYDFIAEKIIKKRFGRDLIYLDKKVSFDEKMNCFIQD